MNQTLNRQVQLARRPRGAPAPDEFRIVDGPVPAPNDGELLLRNLYLSLDLSIDPSFHAWPDERQPRLLRATLCARRAARRRDGGAP